MAIDYLIRSVGDLLVSKSKKVRARTRQDKIRLKNSLFFKGSFDLIDISLLYPHL